MDFFDDDEDWEIGFSVELEQWAAFFEEEKAEIHYEILTKNGEETNRHQKHHHQGIAYIKEHQTEILNQFLTELLKEYPEIQKKYQNFYSAEQMAEFLPDISDISGFAPLLSPTNMFIFSHFLEDLPYYSVGFSCSWEQEHGLGVIMHKNRIIKICDASEIFDVSLIKKDLKNRS